MTGRRGLLILDTAGKEHSLAKRIDGINTKELNAFMRDVDRTALPTVEQAKEQYQERKIAGLEADRATVQREIAWEEALAKAAIEKEKVERKFVEQGPEKGQAKGSREKEREQKRIDAWLKTLPAPDPKSIGGEIREAYSQSDNASSFAASLKEKNLHLAVVTPDESHWIHRGNPYLQEPGKYVPKSLDAGEFVVLNERGHIYQLNVRNTGKTRAEVEAFMGTLDRKEFQGIDATRKTIQTRADEREILRQAFRDVSSAGLLRHDRKPRLGRITAERTRNTPRDSLGHSWLNVGGKVLGSTAGRNGAKTTGNDEALGKKLRTSPARTGTRRNPFEAFSFLLRVRRAPSYAAMPDIQGSVQSNVSPRPEAQDTFSECGSSPP